MSDLLIFGFGLAVTLLVGSGLTGVIVVKNRVKETEEARRNRSRASS